MAAGKQGFSVEPSATQRRHRLDGLGEGCPADKCLALGQGGTESGQERCSSPGRWAFVAAVEFDSYLPGWAEVPRPEERFGK